MSFAHLRILSKLLSVSFLNKIKVQTIFSKNQTLLPPFLKTVVFYKKFLSHSVDKHIRQVYNIGASLKRKEQDMDNVRRLPDAEFDVMNVLWECNVSPVNTAYLMENVGKQKGWKAPTLISFLSRLEERGFIHSEKKGKERYYYADAVKEEYIRGVTIDFLSRYHSGSFVKMMDLMYGKSSMSSKELDEMLKWLQEQY